MGVVRLVFRAEFRHRWRSWVALAVLVALVAGSVMAALAAGRRTGSAYPRFRAEHGYDITLYSFQPLRSIPRLPEAASVTEVVSPANGPPTCSCHRVINSTNFSVFELTPRALPHVVQLESGRLPRQSAVHEVLASFNLERDYGVHVGTVLRVPFYALSQQQALLGGANPTPAGPGLAFRVVGIEATDFEFPVAGGASSYDLYTTGAFARFVNPRTFEFHTYFVRLRHGAADLTRFTAEATRLGAAGSQDMDSAAATLQSSIHPQAVGWWVLAALAALAGLAVLAQALARQALVESEAYGTLSALGLDRRQLAALGMARTLGVALAGAGAGVVLAVGLSPIAPAGLARLAEPSPGVAADGLVLGVGVAVTILVVLALGWWPAARAARPWRLDGSAAPARPSRLVAAVAGVGAPPSLVIGMRQALERGRGRGAVPVGTALLGTVLAMTALCGTAVFGASLTHLTRTPALYGDSYQLFANAGNAPTVPNDLVRALERDPAVTGVTLGASTELSINHVAVNAAIGTPLKGSLLVTNVEGRLPAGDGEVAMGITTLREVGAHLGSVVKTTLPVPSGGLRTVTTRVVGVASFPPDFPGGGLGRGAVYTDQAYEDATCPPGPARSACIATLRQGESQVLLVSVVTGRQGRMAVARYLAAFPQNARLPATPTTLINFGEAVNFPLILGVVLGLFGAATLIHLLAVSVARRRKEMGLLKALGFLHRQVASVVAWQATTVMVVGIVVGVPLGIAAGNLAWRAFARNLGVVPVSVVAAWTLASVAAGAIVLANVIAVIPAVTAAHTQPGELLRAN